MGRRRSEPFGIPIAAAMAWLAPLARRLARWWLLWMLFVVVAWASIASVRWRLDEAIADQRPLAPTLAIDQPAVSTAPSPWCREPAPATPADDDLLARDIDIDLRGGKAEATVSADFAACGAKLARLAATMTGDPLDADDEREVADTVFGYVVLGGGLRRVGALQVLVGDDTTRVTVRASLVEAPPVLSGGGVAALATRRVTVTPSRWIARRTHVRIRFDDGTGAWSSNLAPLRQTVDELVWEVDGKDAYVSAVLRPATAPRLPDTAAPDRDAEPPLMVRLLFGDIAALRSLWLGITVALPFALSWLWATRAKAAAIAVDDPVLDALSDGASLAVGLISALALVEFSERLFASFDWLPFRFPLSDVAWCASVCKTALIAGGLFAYGSWGAPIRRTAGALPLALAGLVVAVAGGLVEPTNVARFTGRLATADVDALPAFVGLGLEAVGALFVAAAIAVESFRWGLAVRGGVALLIAVFVAALVDHLSIRFHVPFAASLLAMPFGWAFASLSRRWLPGAPPVPLWIRAVGALVAALLALPPDVAHHWAHGWLVGATAWALARWWQLPALWLLLRWFARNERQVADGSGSTASLEAAATFLFIVFFWNAQLPYVPLALQTAAGLAVLRWGVFAPRPLSAPKRRHRLVSKTIDDLRGLNALTRLRKTLAKADEDKLAKGELDAQAWIDRRDRDDRVVSRRMAAASRARLRAVLALNRGPSQGAWSRGVGGAIATTAVALPWIATFVAHTTFRTRYGTNAATLSQLGVVTFDLIRWPALGFFFLYFYPLVRGINGIQKGLVLAASVIVPSAAATLLAAAAGHGGWTAFALWSLQVFICCMTVGVGLGDLGALRKIGKGPRALVEVYDLGTLTAWFTAIAIAVGAAATTTIASGAGAILSVGLKLLIPELPIAPGAPHP